MEANVMLRLMTARTPWRAGVCMHVQSLHLWLRGGAVARVVARRRGGGCEAGCCLLYTSDAADDTPCVDL
eukprot:3972388-Pleurochrysis_carterae.AAC.1